METVILLAILFGVVVADSHLDKRILLHSDVDIAQTVLTLKADSVQVHSDLSDLRSQNTQLQSTVSNLQSQNAQLRGDVSQLKGTVSQLQSQNSQLHTTVTNLQSANKGTGSTYVRWGRTICPANGTTLGYSGYMGGGKHSDTGAAANHLCLTDEPIWDYYDIHIASAGKVYGVEYQFFPHHADGAANFFDTNVYNQDAPCAVCHSPRSATVMIPGRNKCYPGWTKEYSGYLVSDYYGYVAATEYICLDRRPEVIPGGGNNDNENMLQFVEGACGKSLVCPPYVDGRELTCVVCSK